MKSGNEETIYSLTRDTIMDPRRYTRFGKIPDDSAEEITLDPEDVFATHSHSQDKI